MALKASARTHNDRSASRRFVIAAAAAGSRCKTRRITHRDYEAGTDVAQPRHASRVVQLSFEIHVRHAPETRPAKSASAARTEPPRSLAMPHPPEVQRKADHVGGHERVEVTGVVVQGENQWPYSASNATYSESELDAEIQLQQPVAHFAACHRVHRQLSAGILGFDPMPFI